MCKQLPLRHSPLGISGCRSNVRVKYGFPSIVFVGRRIFGIILNIYICRKFFSGTLWNYVFYCYRICPWPKILSFSIFAVNIGENFKGFRLHLMLLGFVKLCQNIPTSFEIRRKLWTWYLKAYMFFLRLLRQIVIGGEKIWENAVKFISVIYSQQLLHKCHQYLNGEFKTREIHRIMTLCLLSPHNVKSKIQHLWNLAPFLSVKWYQVFGEVCFSILRLFYEKWLS